MRLAIICEGSLGHGLGHLVRVKAFVEDALAAHDVAVFAIATPELASLFGEVSALVRRVVKAADVLPLVQEFKPDAILFDLLELEEEIVASLKEMAVVTGSISPIFNRMADVDLLFTRFHNWITPAGVKVYSGLEYAILGSHCKVIDDQKFESHLRNERLPVGVAMGGADAPNKTLAIVEALAAHGSNATIWVLLGEGYNHSFNDLAKCGKGNAGIEVILAKTSRSMWTLLSNCCLAVMSGGITCIEAIYAGLPTINLFDSPAQRKMMSELYDMNVCLDGGVYSKETVEKLQLRVNLLNRDREQVLRIRNNTKGLIDGQAVSRILARLDDELASRRG